MGPNGTRDLQIRRDPSNEMFVFRLASTCYTSFRILSCVEIELEAIRISDFLSRSNFPEHSLVWDVVHRPAFYSSSPCFLSFSCLQHMVFCPVVGMIHRPLFEFFDGLSALGWSTTPLPYGSKNVLPWSIDQFRFEPTGFFRRCWGRDCLFGPEDCRIGHTFVVGPRVLEAC